MIIDKLQDLGINLKGRTRGQYKTTCPKCSESRKHKIEPCLSVNIDTGVYSCHNCGWSGGVYEKEDKTYILPQKNNSNLSDPVVAWFKNRGISNGTLLAWGVTEGPIFFPQTSSENKAIHFNYERDKKLINVKYRDKDKNFRMSAGSELIFYGLDKISGNDEVIITEGEIDALSYFEANITSVCSVPNGASKGNQKLEYLDNCFNEFSGFKKIYIATDNDEPGIALRNELARRLGKSRCCWIDFGDCKDANEYLLKYGAELLKETIYKNTVDFPIDGIIRVSDFSEKVDLIHKNGFPKGLTVGDRNFDNHLTYLGGQWTLVLGYPYSGKSELVDQITVSLAYRHDWKIGMFSSENLPYEFHFTKLAEKFCGKQWGSISSKELSIAKSWIQDHFYWININENDLSLESILEKYRELVATHGLNGFVIDPWNEVEHLIPKGMNETQYVSKAMSMVKSFVQQTDTHLWLVTHPTKPQKSKEGKVLPPKLSDASGSMNFVNKAFNGIVVYRDFEYNTTEAQIGKVKFKFLGKHGTVPLHWDGQAGGRFWPITRDSRPVDQAVIDYSTGETSEEIPF